MNQTVVAAALLSLLVTAGARDSGAEQKARPAAIQWFGTWEAGLAEAQESGRPILLVSAAPQCHNVSGLW